MRFELFVTPDVRRGPDQEEANVFSALAAGRESSTSDAGNVVRARVVRTVASRVYTRLFYVLSRLEAPKAIGIHFGFAASLPRTAIRSGAGVYRILDESGPRRRDMTQV